MTEVARWTWDVGLLWLGRAGIIYYAIKMIYLTDREDSATVHHDE